MNCAHCAFVGMAVRRGLEGDLPKMRVLLGQADLYRKVCR